MKSIPGLQGKSVKLEVNLEAALAAVGPEARKHLLEVSVADKSIARHLAVVPVSFVTRIEEEKDAVCLSDLTPVSSFAQTRYVAKNLCSSKNLLTGNEGQRNLAS